MKEIAQTNKHKALLKTQRGQETNKTGTTMHPGEIGIMDGEAEEIRMVDEIKIMDIGAMEMAIEETMDIDRRMDEVGIDLPEIIMAAGTEIVDTNQETMEIIEATDQDIRIGKIEIPEETMVSIIRMAINKTTHRSGMHPKLPI